MKPSDQAARTLSPEVPAVVEETCRHIEEFGESLHQDLVELLERIHSWGGKIAALGSAFAAEHAETRALIKSLMSGSAGAEDPPSEIRLPS